MTVIRQSSKPLANWTGAMFITSGFVAPKSACQGQFMPLDFDKVSELWAAFKLYSRTKSQNLNVSFLILQFSLPSPGVKSRMKM